VIPVVEKLEACAADSIEWASRRDVQFDTAKTEAPLFESSKGHKKPLRPILTPKPNVGNGFVRFITEVTRGLAVWMDAHLTFKEHHNLCMKKARSAEARLRTLTRMHGIVPESVGAAQVAWVEAIALDGRGLWRNQQEIGRREDVQLRLNRQSGSSLGAIPTTPMGAHMRESGFAPVPVALDARQQQFTARLTTPYEGSKLQMVLDHPSSGATMGRVITKEHKRGREAETMRWPNPYEVPEVKMVILS